MTAYGTMILHYIQMIGHLVFVTTLCYAYLLATKYVNIQIITIKYWYMPIAKRFGLHFHQLEDRLNLRCAEVWLSRAAVCVCVCVCVYACVCVCVRKCH
jgi:hypothetical protein